ncbi:MAG: hypothetical protein GQ552_01210, partial [Flavobacteriaceae bacterium]|nr:hypothetical protein [Flavobacteriaceae bacterium]
MKLIKGLLAIALISVIAVSCKETKKEAVEVTEPPVEAVETTPIEVEEVAVVEVMEEKIADTPVVYPGCEGSAEEIRACSIKEFKAFFRKHFNTDLVGELGLDEGSNKIGAMLKI